MKIKFAHERKAVADRLKGKVYVIQRYEYPKFFWSGAEEKFGWRLAGGEP